MQKVGTRPQTLDHDDAFVGGLFAVIAANLLTQHVGGYFEAVAMAVAPIVTELSIPSNLSDVAIDELSDRMAAFSHQVIAAHNESPRTCRAVGENISAWFGNPDGDALERLAGIFENTRQRVRAIDK